MNFDGHWKSVFCVSFWSSPSASGSYVWLVKRQQRMSIYRANPTIWVITGSVRIPCVRLILSPIVLFPPLCFTAPHRNTQSLRPFRQSMIRILKELFPGSSFKIWSVLDGEIGSGKGVVKQSGGGRLYVLRPIQKFILFRIILKCALRTF